MSFTDVINKNQACRQQLSASEKVASFLKKSSSIYRLSTGWEVGNMSGIFFYWEKVRNLGDDCYFF